MVQQAKEYLFDIEEILKRNQIKYKLFRLVGMEHGDVVNGFPIVDGHTVDGDDIFCIGDNTVDTEDGTWFRIAEIEIIEPRQTEYMAIYVMYSGLRKIKKHGLYGAVQFHFFY